MGSNGDFNAFLDSNTTTTHNNSSGAQNHRGRAWRGGSDGTSASSSLENGDESSEVRLTSTNVNGTIVSSLEDKQFVITSK